LQLLPWSAWRFLLNEKFTGLAQRMPSQDIPEDVMYKPIALATILGALWAAEARGGYWSWDPKETWALIICLNYSAWLHMRLGRGRNGAPMVWWAGLSDSSLRCSRFSAPTCFSPGSIPAANCDCCACMRALGLKCIFKEL